MKFSLTIFIFLFSFTLFSQKFSYGGTVGTGFIKDTKIITFGGALEFKPQKVLLSINSDPFILLTDKRNLIFTVPIYLKIILGNKLRVCPLVGGFVRTNSNYGINAGLDIEYKIKENLLIFFKGECYKDFWKAEHPAHFGIPSYEYVDSDYSIWISLGIKKIICA